MLEAKLLETVDAMLIQGWHLRITQCCTKNLPISVFPSKWRVTSEDLRTYMMERVFMATHSNGYSNTPSTPPPPPLPNKPQTKLFTLLCGDFQHLWPTPHPSGISNCTCGNQTTQPQNVEQHFLCTQHSCRLNFGPSHLKKCPCSTVPWLEWKIKLNHWRCLEET